MPRGAKENVRFQWTRGLVLAPFSAYQHSGLVDPKSAHRAGKPITIQRQFKACFTCKGIYLNRTFAFSLPNAPSRLSFGLARLGAIIEDNAGLLHRPLRKKRSKRAQAMRANRAACLPDPRLAQALQSRTRGSSRSMRPVRQHFKPRSFSLPSYGSPPPLRVQQPATPPPSPEKPLHAGAAAAAANRVKESPAESASSPRPTGGKRGPVEDFDGFVSVCGLPGSIATALEC